MAGLRGVVICEVPSSWVGVRVMRTIGMGIGSSAERHEATISGTRDVLNIQHAPSPGWTGEKCSTCCISIDIPYQHQKNYGPYEYHTKTIGIASKVLQPHTSN